MMWCPKSAVMSVEEYENKMNKVTVKIIVATHKPYEMPKDPMYLPLHVGAEGKKGTDGYPLDIGYVKDNTGENISDLNAYFCELTGLYWAWKNLHDDYIGMAHYRRHFSMRNQKGFENVLTYRELEPYIGAIKVFVPNKRKYYIESLYSHYKHTHDIRHLDETRKILEAYYPEYLDSFDRTVKRTCGYMFNMMIMQRELLNDYCTWLFDVLFKLKERVNAAELSAFQGRLFGRVSEILFNVWLARKITDGELKRDEIEEIPCVHMEKINWLKKGTAFLKAKFFGRKYEGSF